MCLPSFISEGGAELRAGSGNELLAPGGLRGRPGSSQSDPRGQGQLTVLPSFRPVSRSDLSETPRGRCLGECCFIILGWYGVISCTWARCCGKFPFALGKRRAGAFARDAKCPDLGLEGRVAGKDSARIQSPGRSAILSSALPQLAPDPAQPRPSLTPLRPLSRTPAPTVLGETFGAPETGTSRTLMFQSNAPVPPSWCGHIRA